MDIAWVDIVKISGPILLGLLAFVWWLRGWTKDITAEISSLRKDTTAEISSLRKDTTAEISSLKKDTTAEISSLKKEMQRFARFVDRWEPILIMNFEKSMESHKSPINLTDYGEEVSQVIDAESLATEYSAQLKAKLEGKSAYEIQEYCFNYAKDEMLADIKNNHPEQYKALTDYAYKEGKEVKKIMRVMGIVLRNKLLDMNGLSH